MRALDTNVLVRYLVVDDEAMASRALRLFKEAEGLGEAFLVTTPVLLESLWVLRSKYRLLRRDIVQALERLLALPVLQFEEPSLVRELILGCDAADIDLADLLIGLHAKSLGVETTLTFDVKAARSRLFKEVP
jgi:predicted nucleic-acid-binding protein